MLRNKYSTGQKREIKFLERRTELEQEQERRTKNVYKVQEEEGKMHL